jgi:response regulator RpfG family c-di-GMP phosphodiesterase
MEKIPNPEIDFEQQKTKYFSNLALGVKDTLDLHKGMGELWGEEGTRDDWRNVTEHCLVEVARVKELGSLLGLGEEAMKNLVVAAAAHDFNKKHEILGLKSAGLSWDNYEKISAESTAKLESAGLDSRLIHIINSVGHPSLIETEELLNKIESVAPTDDEICFLLLHYIDDYTINSEWAVPSEVVEGVKINDLDRRMLKNEANQNYRVINEDGKKHFNGKTTYEMQRDLGNLVEVKIADLIYKRSGRKIDPKDLPFYVDQIIKERITKQ